MKDSIDAILRRPQAEYLESLLTPREALLAEMEHFAAENGHPISDPEVAQLLRIYVRMSQPKRVLEVGTNIGYAVVVMGRELPAHATIETIEINRATLDTARGFVERAHLAPKVIFHEGAALDVMKKLEGTLDFVFIDCVKTEYVDYFELAIQRMKSGGVIVADNVLWKGQVAEGPRAPKEEASTAALKEFNRRLTTDERLLTSVIPVGDGLSVSVVK